MTDRQNEIYTRCLLVKKNFTKDNKDGCTDILNWKEASLLMKYWNSRFYIVLAFVASYHSNFNPTSLILIEKKEDNAMVWFHKELK